MSEPIVGMSGLIGQEMCTVRILDPRGGVPNTRLVISTAGGYRVVLAALEVALASDCPQSVVVVNAICRPVAEAWVQGAPSRTRELARIKAFTACVFDLGTCRPACQPAVTWPIGTAAQPLSSVYAGGIPLCRDAGVPGAIGVSGARSRRTTRAPRPAGQRSDRVQCPGSRDRHRSRRRIRRRRPTVCPRADGNHGARPTDRRTR